VIDYENNNRKKNNESEPSLVTTVEGAFAVAVAHWLIDFHKQD
jgi:hypothetical protein